MGLSVQIGKLEVEPALRGLDGKTLYSLEYLEGCLRDKEEMEQYYRLVENEVETVDDVERLMGEGWAFLYEDKPSFLHLLQKNMKRLDKTIRSYPSLTKEQRVTLNELFNPCCIYWDNPSYIFSWFARELKIPPEQLNGVYPITYKQLDAFYQYVHATLHELTGPSFSEPLESGFAQRRIETLEDLERAHDWLANEVDWDALQDGSTEYFFRYGW